MASPAHCAYCWESLAAHYEHREPLSLTKVQQLWEQYHADQRVDVGSTPVDDEIGVDKLDTELVETAERDARPAAISRLLNRKSASSSSSSLPSNGSSIPSGSGSATPASSISSRSLAPSSSTKTSISPTDEFPLFVTWNTISRSGRSTLRGCIGTFAAQPLEHGLQSYALTSALEDERFQPIPASFLPSLSCHVTLLTNFSKPSRDALAWTLGQHGIRITFYVHHRRLSATYLPDVPVEQGWTKEEALMSLMRKAGWNGASAGWEKVWKDGRGELVTYEGKAVGLHYPEWHAWRNWVQERGL